MALSFLILMGWSAFISKTYHIENKSVTSSNLALKDLPKTSDEPSLIQEKTVFSLPDLNFDQDKFRVDFIEARGAIKEIVFKSYQQAKFSLGEGFFYDDNSLKFKKLDQLNDSISFVHQDENKKIIKRFIFSNINYSIELQIEIENMSNSVLKMQLPITLAFLDFNSTNSQTVYQDIVVGLPDKILRPSQRKDILVNGIKFIGTRNRYFCGIIEPQTAGYSMFIKKIDSYRSKLGLISPEINISPRAKEY